MDGKTGPTRRRAEEDKGSLEEAISAANYMAANAIADRNHYVREVDPLYDPSEDQQSFCASLADRIHFGDLIGAHHCL